MGDLLLVRHGETEWSASGQHTSFTDLPLTPHGEAQAKSLAPLLAGRTFARVVTSPLVRAVRTAELAGLSTALTDTACTSTSRSRPVATGSGRVMSSRAAGRSMRPGSV